LKLLASIINIYFYKGIDRERGYNLTGYSLSHRAIFLKICAGKSSMISMKSLAQNPEKIEAVWF
jgi:hypothetical protein